MTKGVRLMFFHLTGAGLVLIFGVLMVISEVEVPKPAMAVLALGFSLIAAPFIARIISSRNRKKGEMTRVLAKARLDDRKDELKKYGYRIQHIGPDTIQGRASTLLSMKETKEGKTQREMFARVLHILADRFKDKDLDEIREKRLGEWRELTLIFKPRRKSKKRGGFVGRGGV